MENVHTYNYKSSANCNKCKVQINIMIKSKSFIAETDTILDIMLIGLKRQDCNTHRDINIEIDGYLQRSNNDTAVIQCEFENINLDGYKLLPS